MWLEGKELWPGQYAPTMTHAFFGLTALLDNFWLQRNVTNSGMSVSQNFQRYLTKDIIRIHCTICYSGSRFEAASFRQPTWELIGNLQQPRRTNKLCSRARNEPKSRLASLHFSNRFGKVSLLSCFPAHAFHLVLRKSFDTFTDLRHLSEIFPWGSGLKILMWKWKRWNWK